MDPTTIIFIVLLVVLIVALLVVPMFTNKKRAKQTEELHRSLKPGDLIKTVGGIIGTIIEIRDVSPVDKEMVIETGVGDNKTTMIFDIQALYQVMSRSSTVVAPTESEVTPEAKAEEPAVAPVAVPEEEKAEEKATVTAEEQAATQPEEPVQEQAAESVEPKTEEPATDATEVKKPAPAKKKPVAGKSSNAGKSNKK